MTTKTFRKMCVLAGVLVLGATASALPLDARIRIDRALNSPTLTVRYSGATAVLVELRVNGASIGTRTVDGARNAGETNFTLNLSELRDGRNDVEVRLFDRTGKLVGSEKSTITAEQVEQGPVFISSPKMGSTVQGPVEISVGFGREMRNTYVSFFVNDQFKSISNFPPYTFLWDTTRESNGWHEVEAWVIDETSNTYKTRKIRVFVNNPGGRTDRVGATIPDGATSANPIAGGTVTGTEAPLRSLGGGSATAVNDVRTTATPPTTSGATMPNPVKGELGSTSGTKPLEATDPIATGQKLMTPTGTRVAPAPAAPASPAAAPVRPAPVTPPVATPPVATPPVATPPAAPATPPVAAPVTPPAAEPVRTVAQQVPVPKTDVLTAVGTATTLVPITKGQRLPNLASFAVVLNSQFVEFDVNPRVDSGVPMTPFRHLIEKAGGKVEWENANKSVTAQAEGAEIFLQIGDPMARVNALKVALEIAPYLDRGRTIVPLSFIRESLNVEVDFDRATGHVLITTKK
jgi:hypothetical protein